MSFHGFCPQCGSQIPQDRFVTGFAVCECGWFDSAPSQKTQKKAEKRAIHSMIATAVFLVALYAHLVNWGSYATSIPLVKLQKITGTLSKEGFEELATVCMRLGKFDCAKDAYISLYQAKNDLSAVANLAKLNMRLGDNQAAIAAYGSYFRAGGVAAEPALQFAKLLELSGRDDDALKYFETSVATSGETLPVQATAGLVRLLMKRGEYEQALERVQSFHDSAGNARGYLNTELAQLETLKSQQAKSGPAKKSAAKGKRVARL